MVLSFRRWEEGESSRSGRWEDVLEDLRRKTGDGLRGQGVLATDVLIEIRTRAPAALLRLRIERPQTEALGPAALPFEVVHQGPMVGALDSPVEVGGAPELPQMRRQVARADSVGVVLDAVLRNQDWQTVAPGPHQRPPESLRRMGDEGVRAEVGSFGVGAPPEELLRPTQVHLDGLGRVVVEAEEVLRPGRFADAAAPPPQAQPALVNGPPPWPAGRPRGR